MQTGNKFSYFDKYQNNYDQSQYEQNQTNNVQQDDQTDQNVKNVFFQDSEKFQQQESNKNTNLNLQDQQQIFEQGDQRHYDAEIDQNRRQSQKDIQQTEQLDQDTYANKLNVLQSQIQNLQTQKSQLEVFKKDQIQRIQQENKQISELRDNNFLLKDQVKSYEKEIKKLKEKNELLNQEIHYLKMERDQLLQQLNKQNLQIQQISSDRQLQSEQIKKQDELIKQIKHKEKQIQNLAQQNDQILKQIAGEQHLKDEIQNLEKRNTQLNSMNVQLQQELQVIHKNQQPKVMSYNTQQNQKQQDNSDVQGFLQNQVDYQQQIIEKQALIKSDNLQQHNNQQIQQKQIIINELQIFYRDIQSVKNFQYQHYFDDKTKLQFAQKFLQLQQKYVVLNQKIKQVQELDEQIQDIFDQYQNLSIQVLEQKQVNIQTLKDFILNLHSIKNEVVENQQFIQYLENIIQQQQENIERGKIQETQLYKQIDINNKLSNDGNQKLIQCSRLINDIKETYEQQVLNDSSLNQDEKFLTKAEKIDKLNIQLSKIHCFKNVIVNSYFKQLQDDNVKTDKYIQDLYNEIMNFAKDKNYQIQNVSERNTYSNRDQFQNTFSSIGQSNQFSYISALQQTQTNVSDFNLNKEQDYNIQIKKRTGDSEFQQSSSSIQQKNNPFDKSNIGMSKEEEFQSDVQKKSFQNHPSESIIQQRKSKRQELNQTNFISLQQNQNKKNKQQQQQNQVNPQKETQNQQQNSSQQINKQYQQNQNNQVKYNINTKNYFKKESIPSKKQDLKSYDEIDQQKQNLQKIEKILQQEPINVQNFRGIPQKMVDLQNEKEDLRMQLRIIKLDLQRAKQKEQQQKDKILQNFEQDIKKIQQKIKVIDEKTKLLQLIYLKLEFQLTIKLAKQIIKQ